MLQQNFDGNSDFAQIEKHLKMFIEKLGMLMSDNYDAAALRSDVDDLVEFEKALGEASKVILLFLH